MSLNKCLPLIACFSTASLLVGSGTISLAAASNRHPHRVHRTSTVHHYFGGPMHGYYAVHGQYVPGADDRLI
jgi:hypothetical protein